MKKQNKKKSKQTDNRKRNRLIGIPIVILLIASSSMIFYNNTKLTNETDREYVKPYEPSFIKNGQLQFIKKDKEVIKKAIDIEIADSDDKRTHGLMWRRSMPDSVGMLFIFEDERQLSFWMKNTFIPLDIIYINKSMEIVAIRENTQPLSEMPIPSDKSAQYVVEVIAGFCSIHRIETGDKIKFEIIK